MLAGGGFVASIGGNGMQDSQNQGVTASGRRSKELAPDSKKGRRLPQHDRNNSEPVKGGAGKRTLGCSFHESTNGTSSNSGRHEKGSLHPDEEEGKQDPD